jgi:small conductance mechanosensitive channel
MADVEVGIAYDDEIETAVKAVLAALRADPRVLPDPAPEVRIKALGDNSVNLHVRPWVVTADVWKAKAEFHGLVKKALDDAGCSIPFPQRDVHVFAAGNGAPEEALTRSEASSN